MYSINQIAKRGRRVRTGARLGDTPNSTFFDLPSLTNPTFFVNASDVALDAAPPSSPIGAGVTGAGANSGIGIGFGIGSNVGPAGTLAPAGAAPKSAAGSLSAMALAIMGAGFLLLLAAAHSH